MVEERIRLSRNEADALEQEINVRRHIERYAMARQFLFGRVLDASCGVGYGTYLCQKNPDVTEIVGLDCDPGAVEWADVNFSTAKTRFVRGSIEAFADGPFDCLLSLETIEHLDDPRALADLAERCEVAEVVVSFPLKKTTHYNRYHRWDLTSQDIEHIFDRFTRAMLVDQGGDYVMMRLVRTSLRPFAPRRWVRDAAARH
jgi:2-polyprenyl-3-methyl-5-hydroxy-6-metoxy-1,4-benzoquinol methylase